MTASHTPTPWRWSSAFVSGSKVRDNIYLLSPDGTWVLRTLRGNEPSAADAALIVRAVNSHAALVEACKLALHSLAIARDDAANVGGSDCEEAKSFDEPLAALRAALAEARQ